MKFDWRHRTVCVLFCLQLMLMQHAYRSTDFEVHRNWLAITYQLPLNKWYFEATSEWTLDYPPLFAWFEWGMAHVAKYVDPGMLAISNLDYDSDATVLFQRLSVCVTSLVLVAAMLHATRDAKDNVKGLTTFVLVVANAGLIMVDNIHFQYNGILLGLLIWSILMIEQEQYVLAAFWFAVLLNMKHLFAYLAPVYFVFILRHYVLTDSSSSSSRSTSKQAAVQVVTSSTWRQALVRLLLVGGVVLLVCAVSFGPFIAMGQLGQVFSRLFPFARGLCHAYWAPNAWALYSFGDKVLAAVAAAAGFRDKVMTANMAGGVVGVSSYAVLPNIGAGTCGLLTLMTQMPCLVALWKTPKAQARYMFAAAIAYANLCGFMFGYHVHEKAALTVEIPMVLAAASMADWGREYVLFSTAAHVGMFPLLFKVQEVPIRWLLAALYHVVCVWGMSAVHGSGQQREGVGTRSTSSHQAQRHESSQRYPSLQESWSLLPMPYRLYRVGLVVLEVYCVILHKAILGDRLPFVPLLLTSVYCGLGISWVWAWMACWFARMCRASSMTEAAKHD